MQTRIPIIVVLFLCMTLTTGCWDMVEPNQRAIWVGSAIDETPEGSVEFSGQVGVPAGLGGSEASGGGSKQTTYVVKSATGENLEDALQNMQEQLSRKVYVGHREAIFVGEGLAKHGLKKWLDEFGRNPESNVRAKIFMVKGADGKRFLKENADLEQFSSTAALRASRFSGINDRVTTIRNFENTMMSDGIRPVMQVIDLSPDSVSGEESNKKSSVTGSTFHMHGIGLFDKDARLVGYLQDEESAEALWVAGDLVKHTVTTFMLQGNGTIALDLEHLQRRIKSVVNGNKINVFLTLHGTGIIRENNSSLNLYNQQNIRYVEGEFDKTIQQQVQQVITKVQSQYGTDIFGFGEDIHRRHPYQWRMLKDDWDKKFSRVNVTVKVNLIVRHIGNKGPSYIIPSRNEY